MNPIKRLSRSIYVWLLGVAGFIALAAEAYRALGQSGALENESWFHHGVSEVVHKLSQQRRAVIDGAVRLKTGVKGKTEPFNRLGQIRMTQQTVRDAQTQYSNPSQTKRRCSLNDFACAVTIDDFDELKTMTDPTSELSGILAIALEVQKDLLIFPQGIANVGGFLGTAETVDEGANSTSATAFNTTDFQILNGGAGLTMTKIRTSKRIMGDNNVVAQDQYFFYSPKGMEQLLSDPTATSADYSTIQALTSGGFPLDATWYGAKWRESTNLFKTGNIRSCLRIQKDGVGMALGMVKDVELGRDPSHWNNKFAMIKLSGGSVRIDDTCVIKIDIDESV